MAICNFEIPDVPTQFRKARLGDRRLDRRLVAVAEAMQAHPSWSFPDALGSDSSTEAFYRLVNNDDVDWEDIIDAHYQDTLARAVGHGPMIVLQDTTLFQFASKGSRTGLFPTSKGKEGFLGHFALAVSGDEPRRPLGLIGFRPLVRRETPEGRVLESGDRRYQVESDRWLDLALEVIEGVPAGYGLIHVMDREGDFFDLIATLSHLGQDYVVRSAHDRVLLGEEGQKRPARLRETVHGAEVLVKRQVRVSRRRAAGRAPKVRKEHPDRDQRIATLLVRSSRVSIRRPARADRRLGDGLELNVVEVAEVDAPDGVEPVDWFLLTSLPVSTPEEVERVVDVYRARWQIEEFFKALKTGCQYEKRQLESLDSLLVALALLAPIAARLLALRWSARHEPTAPADVVLEADEIEVLRAVLPSRTLPPRPKARHLLLAVAQLGGHLRSNGEPGWLVLGRGLQHLQDLTLGWRAAMRTRARLVGASGEE